MAINGIETLVYGVEDVATSARFFDDFGLNRDAVEPPGAASFTLPEGSHLVIRHRDDPVLPPTAMESDGVREVIWGVTDAASLDLLLAVLPVWRRLLSTQCTHDLKPPGVACGNLPLGQGG